MQKAIKMQKLREQMEDCDFVRWTYPNMVGGMFCKILPRYQCSRFLDGKTCCPSTSAMGAANDIPEIPELSGRGHPNGKLNPDPDTFHVLPWCGNGRKIGQVICNWTWCDGEPIAGDCRTVAQRQLDALAKEGLTLKSTFEYEFRLFKKDTEEPIAQRFDCYSALLVYHNEDFLLDVAQSLYEANGVEIEAIHSELGKGQYEITMSPVNGMRAADNAFLFRQTVRELAHKHGMMASFMSSPIYGDTGSGCHFNHSLWDLQGKHNMMHDSSQPDNLSKLMIHWIAGLQHHSRALAAFCSPTVNCYRRLHGEFAPDYCDWDIDNRAVTYRAKAGDADHPSGTYLENRQPSSAVNPYAAVAVTIAAGLDGIHRKLEPTAKGDRDTCGRLPDTMQEALAALEEDTVLVEALGKQFVSWFVAAKKQIDIKKLGHHNMKVNIESELQAEKDEYLIYL